MRTPATAGPIRRIGRDRVGDHRLPHRLDQRLGEPMKQSNEEDVPDLNEARRKHHREP
jgi:hypothetical protein